MQLKENVLQRQSSYLKVITRIMENPDNLHHYGFLVAVISFKKSTK